MDFHFELQQLTDANNFLKVNNETRQHDWSLPTTSVRHLTLNEQVILSYNMSGKTSWTKRGMYRYVLSRLRQDCPLHTDNCTRCLLSSVSKFGSAVAATFVN